MHRRPRRVLFAVCALAAAMGLSACGSAPSTVEDSNASIKNGARLFVARCAGCHTFDVVGAEGGATKVHDRERVDGPNFNVRREDRASVLYAIRNGGFSGAIMPENIVVGKEAEDVAAFVAKYAGGPRRGNDITPESQPSAAAGGGEAGGGGQETTGGGETTATTQTQTQPETQTQTQPEAQTQTQPEAQTQTQPEAQTQTQGGGGGGQQASARGKQVFSENCASCHTLSDAAATGSVGPNLDDARPDQQATRQKVLAGGGGMPSFRGQLSDEDVNAVAEYVASVAGQ